MLQTFADIVKAANAGGALDKNDFVNDEGIICCGYCGKPKQKWIHTCGKDFFVTFVCECQEKAEKEKARAEAKQKQIQARLDDCFGWVKHNAADDEPDSKLAKFCKKYAEDFTPASKWLIMFGKCGTGKSYRAAQICTKLINRGFKAKFTSLSQIERALWSGDKAEIYNKLNSYDLLVLDDFGAERNTEFIKEIRFNVVDMRYSSGKPIIITTNVNGVDKTDISDQRTFGRIREKSLNVKVEGRDRRATSFENLNENEFETIVEI